MRTLMDVDFPYIAIIELYHASQALHSNLNFSRQRLANDSLVTIEMPVSEKLFNAYWYTQSADHPELSLQDPDYWFIHA